MYIPTRDIPIRDLTTVTTGILADGRRNRVLTRLDRRLTRSARGAAASGFTGRHLRPGLASTTGSASARASSTSRASASTSPPTLVIQAGRPGLHADTRRRAAARDELEGLFGTRATRMSKGRGDRAGPAHPRRRVTDSSRVLTSGRPMQELVLADPDRFWTPGRPARLRPTPPAPVGRPGERSPTRTRVHPARSHARGRPRVRVPRAAARARPHAARHARHCAALYSVPSNDLARRRGRCHRRPRPSRHPPAPAADPTGPEPRRATPDRAASPLWQPRVSTFRSVSCDWAGGGIISTPDDLLTFSSALHHGELIAPASLAFLAEPRNRFRSGIRYGAARCEVRFDGFLPLLRGLPRPVGHIGVLATHLFHDPVHDADIVLNLRRPEMVRSFRTLIAIGAGAAARIPVAPTYSPPRHPRTRPPAHPPTGHPHPRVHDGGYTIRRPGRACRTSARRIVSPQDPARGIPPPCPTPGRCSRHRDASRPSPPARRMEHRATGSDTRGHDRLRTTAAGSIRHRSTASPTRASSVFWLDDLPAAAAAHGRALRGDAPPTS